MGLFSGRPRREDAAAPPVRRDRVMKLMQAYMAMSDADPDNCEAEAMALSDLAKTSTQAEYGAAVEAAKRNGY